MNHKTPLEIFGSLAENFKTLTVEDAKKIIADHCVVREAAGMPSAIAGDWVGPEGFVALMQQIQKTFTDFHYTLENVVTNDKDMLVVKGRNSGKLPGGAFDMPIVEFWTFADGKAVDILPMWHDTRQISILCEESKAMQ